MTRPHKPKRQGYELPVQTFVGKSGKSYIVFRKGNSFHTFVETEAKEAASDCGAPRGNTAVMWKGLWDKNSN